MRFSVGLFQGVVYLVISNCPLPLGITYCIAAILILMLITNINVYPFSSCSEKVNEKKRHQYWKGNKWCSETCKWS